MLYVLNGVETERLTFRLVQENDYDAWLPLFEHPDTARFIGFDHLKTAKEQCDFWFEKVFHRYENDLGGMNVLVDKANGRMVGQCGLLIQTLDDKEELEIGYSVLPEFWNKGYASEASQKCKEEAFKRNFRESIISIVHEENIKSKKVAMKNGMTLDKHTVYHEMQVDVFRINKQEWTI